MPLLEAMAAGTPVIASDIAAVFREIGGKVPLYFNPVELSSLQGALVRVLGNEDLRKQMSKEGVAHSQLFGWDRCAEGVVESYRQALRTA